MTALAEYRELYATALEQIKAGAVATPDERALARAMVEAHFRGRLDRERKESFQTPRHE